MNKKLFAPIFSIAALAAVCVGATYALFTDKKEAKVDITAGKVQIGMTSSIDFARSRYEDEVPFDAVANAEGTDFDAVYENGNTALITSATTGVAVELDRMTPMDDISLKVNVANNSNVNIKWRMGIELKGELIPALLVEFDDVDYSSSTEKTVYTSWSDVVESDVTTLVDNKDLYIAFPDHGDDDNQYQDKEGSVRIFIEAVQGNAEVNNDFVAMSAADLVSFAKNWNEGTPLTLDALSIGADIDMSEVVWAPIGTWDHPYFGEIKGNGHKIIGLSNQGKSVEEIELVTFVTTTTHSYGAAYGLIGVAGSATEGESVKVSNLIFDDIDINLADGNCVGAVIGYAPQNIDFSEKAGGIGAGNYAVDDVIIENVNVTGEIIGKDCASGVIGKAYNPGKLGIKNCVTDALVQSTNGRSAGLAGYASLPSELEIVDNTVKNDVKATKTGVDGIVIGYCVGANHIVYNNEFDGDLYWNNELVITESGKTVTYHFDETGVCDSVNVTLNGKQAWESGLLGFNTNVTVQNSTISWDFAVSGTNNKFVNVTTTKKLSIDGELTVDGGTFSGTNNVGYNDGRVGELLVKNGNFTGLLSLFSGEITIEEGTFVGGPRVRAAQGDAIINISGGRYTVKPYADATEVARTTINYIGGHLSEEQIEGYYVFIPEV